MTSKVALPRLTAKNSPIPPEKDKTGRNRLLKTTGPTASYQWHTGGTAQWKCPGICSAAWNGCEMDVNGCEKLWILVFTSWQSCSKSRHLCIADNEVDGIGSHANSFNIILQVPGGFVGTTYFYTVVPNVIHNHRSLTSLVRTDWYNNNNKTKKKWNMCESQLRALFQVFDLRSKNTQLSPPVG